MCLIPSQTQPESVPFLLLVRETTSAEEVVDDDAETTEIPSSRSVPPHLPPARVVTSEQELPSVIVELKEVEVSEPERASEVDGLLRVSDKFALEDVLRAEAPRAAVTRRSLSGSRSGTSRGLAIALLAALSAAGGTVAGMKVFHVSGVRLGAALHVVR
jgi:hypothetical protein